MKVKGLVNKIYRVSSNSVSCSSADLAKLKEGKTADLKKEDADQLLSMGMVEKITSSKKGDK